MNWISDFNNVWKKKHNGVDLIHQYLLWPLHEMPGKLNVSCQGILQYQSFSRNSKY